MDKHTCKYIHHSGLLNPFLSGNQGEKKDKIHLVIGEIPMSQSYKLLMISIGVNFHFVI